LGASSGSAIGGPVLTDLSRLNEIKNRAIAQAGAGKPMDIWPELARFGLQQVLFVNLFYLKSAVDYLVMYYLFEAMKPGWYKRTNEMMQKQQGRTMIGYKGPGSSIPFVPPQLGLGG
jgi:hypothetical protein